MYARFWVVRGSLAMDEQPGHIPRGVRDVATVPLAKYLVKNNVGSTVKHQANSDFTIISQVACGVRKIDYAFRLSI